MLFYDKVTLRVNTWSSALLLKIYTRNLWSMSTRETVLSLTQLIHCGLRSHRIDRSRCWSRYHTILLVSSVTFDDILIISRLLLLQYLLAEHKWTFLLLRQVFVDHNIACTTSEMIVNHFKGLLSAIVN